MAYLKFRQLSEIEEGDKLFTDSGFTCIGDGCEVLIKKTAGGDLFFDCDEGTHLLDGQEGDSGECVGLYRKEDQ